MTLIPAVHCGSLKISLSFCPFPSTPVSGMIELLASLRSSALHPLIGARCLLEHPIERELPL